MTPTTLLKRFNMVANYWLKELEKYSEEQLRKKPSEEMWSMGQLYEHLTTGTTRFQPKNLQDALKSTDQAGKRSIVGRMIFALGSYPPNKVRVVFHEDENPQQPQSKEEIRRKLKALMAEMKELASTIENGKKWGKTRHPSFGYLSPSRWLQVIEMHFRHHIGTKQKIDKVLGTDKMAAPAPEFT